MKTTRDSYYMLSRMGKRPTKQHQLLTLLCFLLELEAKTLLLKTQYNGIMGLG